MFSSYTLRLIATEIVIANVPVEIIRDVVEV